MKAADRLSEGEQPEVVIPVVIPAPPGRSTFKPPPRPDPDAPVWPPRVPVDLPADAGKEKTFRHEVKLAEVRAFVADPDATTASLRTWLSALGYEYPDRPGGKARPLKQHLRELRIAAAFSGQVRQLIRQCDRGPRFTEVLLMRFEQALMQQMFRLGEDGKPVELTTTDLKEMAKLLEQAVDSRKQWETLRRDLEGDKPAGSQITYREVSDRVRQILGIPTDDDPVEEDLDPPADYFEGVGEEDTPL